MAKRASREAKPIEDMMKDELAQALKAERVKNEALLDSMRFMLNSLHAQAQPVPTKKRWAVYGRCQS